MALIFAIIPIIFDVATVIIVGLVAGFSAVLYAAQYRVLARKQSPVRGSLFLMAGVSLGLLVVTVVFAVTQPEFIQWAGFSFDWVSAYRSRLVDVALWVAIGVSGVVLLRRSRTSRSAVNEKRNSVGQDEFPLGEFETELRTGKQAKGGDVALFSLGLVRSVTRVSGLAALLYGVRMIYSFTLWPVLQLGLLGVLLVSSLAPYLVLFGARFVYPEFFQQIGRKWQKTMAENLHSVVAVGLLVASIILVLGALL